MKQISNAELAMIVTHLLDVGSEELPGAEDYSEFMTSLTDLVCRHCGGEVRKPADNTVGTWYIAVHGNDSLPSDEGIWKQFDPGVSIFDDETTGTP